MDKLTFCYILESALLSYDGMTFEKLVALDIDPKIAKTGIKLKDYLTGKSDSVAVRQ